MSNYTGSSLWHYEFALVQVSEQITANEQLHHNLDWVLILKNIVESDNAGVLQNLDYLDFTLEEFKILQFQIFLFDYFDGNILPGSLVHTFLDDTVLTLT